MTAHVRGAGRHDGRLGSLQCEMPDGTVSNVGTGLSDAERNDPPPVGSIVAYRYQELSNDGCRGFRRCAHRYAMAAAGCARSSTRRRPSSCPRPGRCEQGQPSHLCARGHDMVDRARWSHGHDSRRAARRGRGDDDPPEHEPGGGLARRRTPGSREARCRLRRDHPVALPNGGQVDQGAQGRGRHAEHGGRDHARRRQRRDRRVLQGRLAALQIRPVSTGYHKKWNVQFPKDLRELGAKYVVDELRESGSGGFYRVHGTIRKLAGG